MKRIMIISACFVLITGISGQLFADGLVKKVNGEVAVKSGARWVPVKEGAVIKVGDRLSTGINSSAVLEISSATVTVKPMTIVRIVDRGVTTVSDSTTIGISRGGINAKVRRQDRVQTQFRVSTPVATSSVRGTEENIFTGPSGMVLDVPEGVVETTGWNASPLLILGQLIFEQFSDQGRPESHDKHLNARFATRTSSVFITDEERKGEEKSPFAGGGADTVGGDALGGFPGLGSGFTSVGIDIVFPE